MKKVIVLGIAACLFISIGADAAEAEIKYTFNAKNVILPSSQYTPEQPYSALVWVYKGSNYNSSNYNKILASPSADKSGNEWYSPEYEPEDVTSGTWSTQTAPFSSDEYYLGQKSYRWVTAEVMGEMYMRRSFTLSEADVLSGGLYLACGHDDAPSEWYINGVKVHSVADGWNNDEYVLLSDEQKSLIKTDGSENLLAVHVHQNWGGAFADCGLYAADMSIVRSFLPTVADGPWPCSYYLLNYNSDFANAESAKWYDVTEDESDWIQGVGPFSNDQNMFYITEWPSQVRPILIRRHFSIDAQELETIADSDLTFSCSYDEEPVAYLNGTKIWSASGWNDNDYARMTLTDEQKALLVEGDNVLAMSLRQGGGGGHADFGLFIESPYTEIGTSGVIDEESDHSTDNRIYNLHGQYLGTSLESLQSGIYIRNGKKILK
ncbi:MAG: hypothetical protein K2K97_04005 [Muribaculaceae bacterium]|nr:hypothetical protein [Muribaculaceae bacterium]